MALPAAAAGSGMFPLLMLIASMLGASKVTTDVYSELSLTTRTLWYEVVGYVEQSIQVWGHATLALVAICSIWLFALALLAMWNVWLFAFRLLRERAVGLSQGADPRHHTPLMEPRATARQRTRELLKRELHGDPGHPRPLDFGTASADAASLAARSRQLDRREKELTAREQQVAIREQALRTNAARLKTKAVRKAPP